VAFAVAPVHCHRRHETGYVFAVYDETLLVPVN
jgi:hypothetical protein